MAWALFVLLYLPANIQRSLIEHLLCAERLLCAEHHARFWGYLS